MTGISFVVGPQRANLVASICTHRKHSDRASSLIPWCCLLDLGLMQLGDVALGLGMCKAKDRRGRATSRASELPYLHGAAEHGVLLHVLRLQQLQERGERG